MFLDQVDEFFSDVGLDLQVVWWIELEDMALTVPFPFAVLLGGLVLEDCVVPVFLKRQFVIIFGFVEFVFVARQVRYSFVDHFWQLFNDGGWVIRPCVDV